ncbi:nucleotidyltransferase family protein [Cohnella sp. GCM10027633]|uniref:nucleotidyltransferase family protein n=1 Tax=unclassified Cohnella TaxID=2636738 RepID=UPI0036330600
MRMREQDIAEWIACDERMMHVLRCVRQLRLPDSCVCAGFIRSKVWDALHGFDAPTALPDVDVVYYDAADTSERTEQEYEIALLAMDGSIPWSVKNQARMHAKSGHSPYVSTADGLAHFPETCTAIGAHIDAKGNVQLIAPYGVEDLVRLIVRPTPYYLSPEKIGIYRKRITDKNWREKWHRLTILEG